MEGMAAVFLDGGYIDKILSYHFKEYRLNYERFSDILCDHCERFRTYYY